jgi:hypothetical protein
LGFAVVCYAAYRTGAFFRRSDSGKAPIGDEKIVGFDTSTRLQYRLSKDYHQQCLAQSRMSFWFSLIFASLGFLIISASVIAAVSNRAATAQPQPIFALVAGTIIDAVSALFFVQSNKARKQMAEFFDKLRADQKLQDALDLCSKIPDPALQKKVRSVLAPTLSECQLTENLIASIALDLPKSESAGLQPKSAAD